MFDVMKILIALLALVATVAPALAARDCRQLADSFHASFENFPAVIGEPRELVTWRAACAEAPPTGDGNVVALCEGDTDGLSVFYWLKKSDTGEVAGYLDCAY